MLLHREIDHYTDNHPIVIQSKDRLRKKYNHYAGVIVDMFYDHFLAKYFDQYSDIPLQEFTQESYSLMQQNEETLPERCKNMLAYMIRGNWLLNYAKPQGIHRSLQGLSRRTKFDSKLDQAIQELYTYNNEFRDEFEAFFPEIQSHISQFREDLINSSQ